MGIVNGSRYNGQPVIPVPVDDRGDMVQAVFGPPPAGPQNFVYYTVVDGDRYDTIAYNIFGIPDYWWIIANANPEVFYPENLVPGSIIRIPTT